MQFITCPKCKSQKTSCKFCLGYGLVLEHNGQKFSWQQEINSQNINLFKIKKYIQKFLFIFLIIITISAFIVSAFAYYNYLSYNYPVFDFFINQTKAAAIFWLAVFLSFFNIYLISSYKKSIQKIDYQKITQKNKKNNTKKIQAIEKFYSKNLLELIYKSYQNSLQESTDFSPLFLLKQIFLKDNYQNFFERLNIDPKIVLQKINHYLELRLNHKPPEAKAKITSQTQQIFYVAFLKCLDEGENVVEIKHLLLALSSLENETTEIFQELELNEKKIKNTFDWLETQKKVFTYWKNLSVKSKTRPKGPVNRAYTSIATPMLDSFSEDLTHLAQNSTLEPSLGCEKNIKSIYESLAAGYNSIILNGESGTGKTTTLNYLAELMASEEVPSFFQDKRLVKISVSALVSGASKRGEIEARFFSLLKEVARSKNIILYIDKLEELVGLSSDSSKSLDLASALAGEIEKKYFVLISSTTPDSFEKYINKTELSQISSIIKIEPMEYNNAIRALGVRALVLEQKFKDIFFTYPAVDAAVELSLKIDSSKELPGRAVEILQKTAQNSVASANVEPIITYDEVAKTVSQISKIPFEKLQKNETQKLLNLEKLIHQRIIDQQEAVTAIANALRRAKTKTNLKKRPLASFLFLGPTGVGKTEVAKTLAAIYFNGEESIIRLDMSEYSDEDGIRKLIGVANRSGYLINQIKQRPASLILLDEFEKASQEVQHLFLQVFEDGRLTDSQGKTHDFSHSLIIATSNAASDFIQQKVSQNQPVQQIKHLLIENKLSQFFKPELINRFDSVIVFKPLNLENVKDIARLMLNKLRENFEQNKNIDIEFSNKAVQQLAKQGLDEKYGARPLRRLIQERIENILAKLILSQKLQKRDKIIFTQLDKYKLEKAKKI